MSFPTSDTPDVNSAADNFFHVVEGELRKQARSLRAARPTDPVLQTTLLVNEAFLRLVNGPDITWRNEAHFLRLSYGVMKRILADHFRRRRPGQLPGQAVVPDHRVGQGVAENSELMQAFADAFEQLDSADPSAAAAFSLCFFHSLGVSNRADLLSVIREYTGDHLPMRVAADRLDTSAAGVCRAVDRAVAFLSRELRGHAD